LCQGAKLLHQYALVVQKCNLIKWRFAKQINHTFSLFTITSYLKFRTRQFSEKWRVKR
jgi:hypothetical protein